MQFLCKKQRQKHIRKKREVDGEIECETHTNIFFGRNEKSVYRSHRPKPTGSWSSLGSGLNATCAIEKMSVYFFFQKDKSVQQCYQCNKKFSIFYRRHHCRNWSGKRFFFPSIFADLSFGWLVVTFSAQTALARTPPSLNWVKVCLHLYSFNASFIFSTLQFQVMLSPCEFVARALEFSAPIQSDFVYSRISKSQLDDQNFKVVW